MGKPRHIKIVIIKTHILSLLSIRITAFRGEEKGIRIPISFDLALWLEFLRVTKTGEGGVWMELWAWKKYINVGLGMWCALDCHGEKIIILRIMCLELAGYI